MVKNRIQLLKEIEQNIEQEISFLGGRFKTISDLKNYEKNKKRGPVEVNKIQNFHARNHPKYSIIFNRKYLKLLHRYKYCRELLYEQC